MNIQQLTVKSDYIFDKNSEYTHEELENIFLNNVKSHDPYLKVSDFHKSDFDFKLKEGQYISDIKCELLPYLKKNLKIKAETGLGKSYSIMNYMLDDTLKYVIYMCPTNMLVTQLAYEHELLAIKNNSTIPKIYTGSVKTATKGDCIIYTNFAMANPLLKLLGDDINKYTIITDESHTHVSNSSEQFQGKYLKQWVRLYKKFNNHIQITATDLYHNIPELKSHITINIKREFKKNKNIYFVEVEDVIETTINMIHDFIEKGEHFKISLNDTSRRLKKLIECAKASGINDLLVINSKTKNDKDVVEFVNSGDMSKFSGCVATSSYQNGNSITNHSKIVHNIIIGNHHVSAIEQGSNRFRNAEENNTYMITERKRKPYETTYKHVTDETIVNSINQSANGFLKLCQDFGKDRESFELKKRYLKRSFKDIIILKKNGTFEINEVKKALTIYEEQIYHFNNNKEYARSVLENGYNFNIYDDISIYKEVSKKFSDIYKKIDEEHKIERAKQYDAYLKYLESLFNRDIVELSRYEIDHSLPKFKKQILEQLTEIIMAKNLDFGDSAITAINIRRSIGSSTIKYNRWFNSQLNLKYRGVPIQVDDSTAVITVKNIFNFFKDYNKISIISLNQHLNEIMSPLLTRNLQSYPLSINESTAYIQEFFRIEYCGDNKSKVILHPLV